MSDKPTRRFWQIHLSTAVVLMFVASGILWANLLPKTAMYERVPVPPQPGMMFHFYSSRVSYGWPFLCFDHYTKEYQFWSWLNFVFNVGTAIAAMLLVLIASELLIRRREARKP